jgi:hypothetical protein
MDERARREQGEALCRQMETEQEALAMRCVESEVRGCFLDRGRIRV